jgi:hypothetical protein
MSDITHNEKFRKALVVLLISTITTTSVTSISMIEDAEASRAGLKVIVHGGEGRVCVNSDNEGAGCEFADGGTLEFEFSPGAVEVGDRFEACDDNGCKSGRNGEEKAPEHISLGGGSGESGDDDFGGSTGQGTSGGRINWEDLCVKYGDRIDISSDECSRYADGTQLTQAGKDFLVCNLIARVGPVVLGLDIPGIGVGSLLATLC